MSIFYFLEVTKFKNSIFNDFSIGYFKVTKLSLGLFDSLAKRKTLVTLMVDKMRSHCSQFAMRRKMFIAFFATLLMNLGGVRRSTTAGECDFLADVSDFSCLGAFSTTRGVISMTEVLLSASRHSPVMSTARLAKLKASVRSLLSEAKACSISMIFATSSLFMSETIRRISS